MLKKVYSRIDVQPENELFPIDVSAIENSNSVNDVHSAKNKFEII
jgi:hypothetical protein